MSNVSSIRWLGDKLSLLDQRLLPQAEQWYDYCDAKGVAGAIIDMIVRGAPAIGIAAAYGVVLSARQHNNDAEKVLADIEGLAASRPTAVNLFWALKQMREAVNAGHSLAQLEALAQQIHQDDLTMNLAMSRHGADLISQVGRPVKVLTHCNTGALATGGQGTALGVIRELQARGQLTCVFADETRPWHQGSRLTAWELMQEGIEVVLNVDSAAALIMAKEQIDWVIVGADRITANGDVANKIGTFALALIARSLGVKFMVVAPTSTVDMHTASGDLIEIEQRPGDEIIKVGEKTLAPKEVKAFNPVFDVTPHQYIDAIVTEKGVIERPDEAKMRAAFG